MKKLIRTEKILIAGMAVAVLTACGGGGADAQESADMSPEYAAYMTRQDNMDALGEALGTLNGMANEEIPADDAAFTAAARSMADVASNILDGFDNETVVAESRSTPDVWANWDDFVSKAEDLQAAASALAAAAESGGFAAGRALVADARTTCGGCHRPYRGPDPDRP